MNDLQKFIDDVNQDNDHRPHWIWQPLAIAALWGAFPVCAAWLIMMMVQLLGGAR